MPCCEYNCISFDFTAVIHFKYSLFSGHSWLLDCANPNTFHNRTWFKLLFNCFNNCFKTVTERVENAFFLSAVSVFLR